MILEGGVPLPETAGAHFTRFCSCTQRHMEYSVGVYPFKHERDVGTFS